MNFTGRHSHSNMCGSGWQFSLSKLHGEIQTNYVHDGGSNFQVSNYKYGLEILSDLKRHQAS